MMKKMLARAMIAACLFAVLVPSCACASLADKIQDAKDRSVVKRPQIWLSENGSAHAKWEVVSGGVNFSIKVSNPDDADVVDACTFEISAENVYEEPVLLRSSNGECCESLQFTSEKVLRPGASGYTEYFKLRSDEKIRYVTIKMVRYHVEKASENAISYPIRPENKEYEFKIK